jgi:hypothetical protein
MKYICLLLTFLTLSAKAQTLFSEKYKECIVDSPCYYCGDTVAHYKRDFVKRIQYNIDHGLMKWMETSGRMFLEVQVDSTGHSCVRSIKDETRMWDVKNTVRMAINQLYDWTPAISDHHPINSTVILEAHFVGSRASVRFIKRQDIR